MVRLKQLLCGVRGHDAVLRFGDGRLSLHCTSCDYETPGWDLRAAVKRPHAMRPRVVRLPLSRERRVA